MVAVGQQNGHAVGGRPVSTREDREATVETGVDIGQPALPHVVDRCLQAILLDRRVNDRHGRQCARRCLEVDDTDLVARLRGVDERLGRLYAQAIGVVVAHAAGAVDDEHDTEMGRRLRAAVVVDPARRGALFVGHLGTPVGTGHLAIVMGRRCHRPAAQVRAVDVNEHALIVNSKVEVDTVRFSLARRMPNHLALVDGAGRDFISRRQVSVVGAPAVAVVDNNVAIANGTVGDLTTAHGHGPLVRVLLALVVVVVRCSRVPLVIKTTRRDHWSYIDRRPGLGAAAGRAPATTLSPTIIVVWAAVVIPRLARRPG